VLIADDHQILREGLAGILRNQPDLEIVGEAANGLAALELARKTKPDVVLMDIHMPQMNGIEATRRITSELKDIQLIGLSMNEEESVSEAMKKAGALDYFTKGGSTEALLASIRGAVQRVS